MTPARLSAIAAFRLVTAEPARLASFYQEIGFEAGATVSIDPGEMHVLGLEGAGWRLPLRLGRNRVELDWYEQVGRRYPEEVSATDVAFQHLALVTDDVEAAWARACAAGATAISRNGPVRLPASSGGVTAVKFRDPEGHPLELIQFPSPCSSWFGRSMRGVDHSAIVVSDISRSLAFYSGHGLRMGAATHNRGTEQDALDGAYAAEAAVVAMVPDLASPHVELLGYETPSRSVGCSPDVPDVAATRIVWSADRDALLRDPDGHLHQLMDGVRR